VGKHVNLKKTKALEDNNITKKPLTKVDHMEHLSFLAFT